MSNFCGGDDGTHTYGTIAKSQRYSRLQIHLEAWFCTSPSFLKTPGRNLQRFNFRTCPAPSSLRLCRIICIFSSRRSSRSLHFPCIRENTMCPPSNELYTVPSFIGFIMSIIPFHWHLEGTCTGICILHSIDSIVWNKDMIDKAPVTPYSTRIQCRNPGLFTLHQPLPL
jgi:hypothetical protein